MSTNTLKEYKNLYKRYKEEHGERIVLLMQIGKFYEVYTMKEKEINIGNAEEISEILEIKMTRKDSNKEYSESNPYFTGFPLCSTMKYIKKLIKNDYTVIVYDQEETDDKKNIKRVLKGIYTNTITPLESEFESEDNFLLISVITETGKREKYNYGYTLFNNRTNEIYVNYLDNKSKKEINQEIYNIETIFNIKQKIEKRSDEIEKCYKDKEYCNILLKEVYKNTEWGILRPIQFLFNEEYNWELIESFCYLLNLLNKYNPTLLVNISKPLLYNLKNNKMRLHLNTISQLHLNSLKDYVVNCNTCIGRRRAVSLLYEPYSDKNEIVNSMLITKEINPKWKEIRLHLKKMKDIVKIHRELSTYSIKIDEIYPKIIKNYRIICEIINLLDEKNTVFEKRTKNELKRIIESAVKDIEYNIVEEYEETKFKNDSKWKTENIKNLENEREKILKEFENEKSKYSIYDKEGYLKLEIGGMGTTEYFYKITSSRLSANKKLREAIERDGLIKISQKTNIKIISPKLNEIWAKIEILNSEINIINKYLFKEYIRHFIEDYSEIFEELKEIIEKIDIAVMNNYNNEEHNYNEITFINEKQTLRIKDLRHPIIERINDNVDYIANDIDFTENNKGIVLYGINSSGKSSLIRSLGISVIMAQCGFYVPCTKFEISEPYKNIMCQVDLQDDIFKGNSSYVTEAIGIKYMLSMLENKERTIVIADELTRGTENKSAIAIFGATVKRMLSEESCNFIFTTHLHEISELKTLQNDIKKEILRIKHIKVEICSESGEFIFKRKLEAGTIDSLYGLEIVKSIIEDKIFDPFIIEAESIRKEICGEKEELVTYNKSNYNKKKIVDKCEICGYKKIKENELPLDVHHIRFQCNTNEKGFVNESEYIHKNNKSNLIVLCKQCHIKVHKNEIKIDGYVETSKGIKIKYFFV